MTYNQGYGAPPQPPKGAGGYLYPNDKKQRAEQPDQKGKIRIGEDIVARIMAGEREFYISGWNKQDQKGGKFLSVAIKQIEARQGPGGYGAPQQAAWGAPPPQGPAGGYPPQPQYGHPAPQMPQQGRPPMGPQPIYGAPVPQMSYGGHPGTGGPQYGAPVMNDEIPF